MTIRALTANEWPLVAPIFEAEGGTLPRPECACIVAAFDDDGALAGFWTLQLAYHAGPLWIRPDQRGTGLWRRLHEVLHRLFAGQENTGYYSFSGQPKVESIFKSLGYKDLGYKVWAKEV